MKNKISILSALVTLSLVAGCGRSSPTSTLPTYMKQPNDTTTAPLKPTNTPVPPTETPTLTDIPTATPTPVPQIFQPIFPEGFTGAGVASHHYCTQDDIGCLHFDVGIPMDFLAEKDAIISPASGMIINHYFPGDSNEGECITIKPEPPLQGIDELVLSYGRDPVDVKFVYYQLAHIFTFKTSGRIDVGEDVGVVHDRKSHLGQWSNIVAFVVRIGFEYDEIQVSPCELPNDYYWCDVCYPGAAERNPCP